jgi:hypothetical protein
VQTGGGKKTEEKDDRKKKTAKIERVPFFFVRSFVRSFFREARSCECYGKPGCDFGAKSE